MKQQKGKVFVKHNLHFEDAICFKHYESIEIKTKARDIDL